ncbi:MAG: hypothetical protein IJ035_01315 [Oscillospiraceae bacterium]|nr:hypothetical protein [Oscillospiraceae bacterium]
MNNRKIEQLYKSHAENTAPDMDALWERIESNLEEKSDEAVTSKPIRRSISLTKKTALAAACVATLIIVPAAVRNMDISNSDMATDSAPMAEQTMAETPAMDGAMGIAPEENVFEELFDNKDEQNDAVAEEELIEAPAEEEAVMEEATGAGQQAVYYEDLQLGYANAPLTPSGATTGDDFFVEENVLIETDIIVNAYIDRVYSGGNGEICYEITADNVETGETESIYLTSRTPYVMLENRCYVLPLKADETGYSLVFENAPQIERTLDGGYIFHNGWETLDENAFDVIYPQGGVDDFFYDRMKFSYGSLDTLIERWHEVKD